MKVEELATSIVASVSGSPKLGIHLVAKWINFRYSELCSRVKFKHLRTESELYAPAPVQAGTVAVTSGSSTVTGTDTAFDTSMIGWQFRVYRNWFTVREVQSATSLLLESPYTEYYPSSDYPTSGLAYWLIQRFLPLDQSVRWLSGIRHPRLFRPLRNRSQDWLNQNCPGRILVGPFPAYWAEAPTTLGSNPLFDNKRKYIEIYPPSSVAEIYKYLYWMKPLELLLQSELPDEIDPSVLREGVKLDVYEYLAHLALQQGTEWSVYGNPALLLNQQARQRTIWEHKLEEAQQADSLANETLIEYYSTGDNLIDRDIVSAEDQVLVTSVPPV